MTGLRPLVPAGLLLALVLTGCSAADGTGPASGSGSSTAGSASGGGSAAGVASTADTGASMPFRLSTVRAQLDAIQVRPVDPYSDYDRVGDFGESWADVDANGCDTRSDVLRRDLSGVRLAGPCKVDTGTLHDPYSGRTVPYVRGPESSEAVQIDHLVPVYEAWRTGAQSWSKSKRVQFANDPLNLLAVDGDANQDKGDQDPSRWLPELKSYQCEYVERYVTVVAKYGLFVTSREKPAIARVLASCPS